MLQLERNLAIQKEVLKGKTYDSIAKEHNITRQRVYAIAKRDFTKSVLKDTMNKYIAENHNHIDTKFMFCPVCGKALYENFPTVLSVQS